MLGSKWNKHGLRVRGVTVRNGPGKYNKWLTWKYGKFWKF